MQIVAILSSPRRSGNGEKLLQRFLSFAPKEAQVDVVVSGELHLQFCRRCRFCESKGYCVLKDERGK